MIERGTRQRLLQGEVSFGFELILGSVPIAEMMASTTVDFVLLDLQHGRWSHDTALAAIMAFGSGAATPMARVQRNDYWHIGRLLDDGFLGIVVPSVDTRDEARLVAEAAHYPPRGKRSWGWGRAPFRERAAYRRRVEDEAFIAVQIESAEAVANAEAILATDGIDGCWIGPSDLALSMGLAPEEASQHAEHAAAIERTLRACRDTGKVPGFATGSADEACARAGQGFRFLTVGNDATFVQAACGAAQERIQRYRRETGSSAPHR
jgi:4-hydroxy-2-oxoheptanedioate aldolase